MKRIAVAIFFAVLASSALADDVSDAIQLLKLSVDCGPTAVTCEHNSCDPSDDGRGMTYTKQTFVGDAKNFDMKVQQHDISQVYSYESTAALSDFEIDNMRVQVETFAVTMFCAGQEKCVTLQDDAGQINRLNFVEVDFCDQKTLEHGLMAIKTLVQRAADPK
jgi:hypothetical protein